MLIYVDDWCDGYSEGVLISCVFCATYCYKGLEGLGVSGCVTQTWTRYWYLHPLHFVGIYPSFETTSISVVSPFPAPFCVSANIHAPRSLNIKQPGRQALMCGLHRVSLTRPYIVKPSQFILSYRISYFSTGIPQLRKWCRPKVDDILCDSSQWLMGCHSNILEIHGARHWSCARGSWGPCATAFPYSIPRPVRRGQDYCRPPLVTVVFWYCLMLGTLVTVASNTESSLMHKLMGTRPGRTQ